MKKNQTDRKQKTAKQVKTEDIHKQDNGQADLEINSEDDEEPGLDFGGLSAPGDLKKQLGCGG